MVEAYANLTRCSMRVGSSHSQLVCAEWQSERNQETQLCSAASLGAGADPPLRPINHVPISVGAEQCLCIQKSGVSILIVRDKFHCLPASRFL